MNSRWLKGLSGEEKEARRKEIVSYKNAFQALTELLEEDFEERKVDYDCPSWSHKQADQNGANRKLQSILNLIKL